MKKMKPDTIVEFMVGPKGTMKKFYRNSITGEIRRRWWTKARVPGTVRPSRLPGGSGFRNNWEADADTTVG